MKSCLLRVACALALIALPAPRAFGQFSFWGQDPASIRWKQIQTENFQVIFPENYADKAAEIADVLEFVYERGSQSLNHRPRKVSVILHNRTVVSNGFVGWAPARLEMFTTPPQDLGSHDWLEMLAIHEFRHVVQIDKMNQGITRLLSLLLGESAAGIVLGLHVPLWLMEGDAVVMETALTRGGRGRQPAFEQGLRAQILDLGVYSFDKAVFGSYKNHVPNVYELGYQLVAAGRVAHGRDVWDKVLDNVALRPWHPAALSSELKRQTGANAEQYYQRTLLGLEKVWKDQAERQIVTEALPVSPAGNLYTNYTSPNLLENGELMALKTALDDIPRVVALAADGSERRLFTPGPFNAGTFSTNGRLIVWSETRRDLRWEHRSWSEIHSYDIRTGRTKRVTERSRYFAPAVSPDGTRIAAVEVSEQSEYALIAFDPATGRESRRFPSPAGAFLMTPSWRGDDASILAVALDGSGLRIVSVDWETGTFETLFHAGHVEISRPRHIDNNRIVFNGAFSGVDGVYLLDLRTSEVRGLAASRFGAVDAGIAAGGTKFFWSEYTGRGSRIVRGAVSPGDGPLLEEIEDLSPGLPAVLAAQEEGPVSVAEVPRREHDVRPYSKTAHLVNIHSWGPYAVNVDTFAGNPGASIFSQNILSTAFFAGGYSYDPNERLGKYYLDASWLGWYPALDLTAETGLRRSHYLDGLGNRVPFVWRENAVKFGVGLPLSTRRGSCFYGLSPSIRGGVIQAASADGTPAFFRDNAVQTLEYRILAYHRVLSSARDLRPRWAQALDLNYRQTPFGKTDMGSVASARAVVVVPGLAKHHSLRLSAAYQKHVRGELIPDTINYTFPNLVNYPRGVTAREDDNLASVSADYAFPLFHPDWSLPPVIYLKRIHLNLFADHARAGNNLPMPDGTVRKTRETLNALGLDLVGTLHLFRIFSPLDLGVRAIYRPEERTIRFDFLVAVGF
ncbi:MAG: hypothetical protein SCM96_12875 [Acidobacteriota bacterium]|nr:hypothetical protein [Acidobacteriota bacterium]